MKSEPILPKLAVFLLLALCFLQWNGVAASRPDPPSKATAAAVDLPSSLTYGETLAHPWQMLGQAAAITDFDGDNKADVAIGRVIGNQYGIVIHLSSRPDVTVLMTSGHLAGFTIRACDINQDSFQDIVVTSLTAPHPLAVWLGDGKGGFTAADETRFDNGHRLTQEPRYDGRSFPCQQNLLTEPTRPACEKPNLAFGDSRPERDGFITCKSIFQPLRHDHFLLTPRSPPVYLPL
jgi:hypothetical protein